MTSGRHVVAATLLTVAVLTAVVVGAGPAAAQTQPDRVSIDELTPLPAHPDVSPEAQALRAELLGPHALDPGHVTLHWYGVSSFIVTVGRHLFLFDAWEIIGAHTDYAPIGREELAALEPEAILIGHGHFDHAADAGYVAGRTGAVVVGSTEICDTAKEDAARDGLADRFTCVITGTMDEPPPGTLQELRLFEDLEPITVLQHIHSAATPPGDSNQPDPFLPVFDPQPYVEHLHTDPEALARFLETLGDPQGGTWMYHLRLGHFSLLLGDSAGPIFQSPDVREALDSFPTCVDVMANAILGFDQPVSGLQDPRLYVEHAHPKVFVPTHADAWAPVISAGQEQYVDEMEAQLATLEHPPEVVWMFDPEDYLQELAFATDDPRWAAPPPGSSCAAASAPPAPPTEGSVPGGAAEELPASGPSPGGSSAALTAALVGLAALALGRVVRPRPGGRRQSP